MGEERGDLGGGNKIRKQELRLKNNGGFYFSEMLRFSGFREKSGIRDHARKNMVKWKTT